MWSHYANQHRGAALKFYFNQKINFLANPEITKDPITGSPNIFKRVQYRKRPKFKVDSFDTEYHFSPTLIDEIVQAVLLQKSEDWIYEQERRLILPLIYADKVIVNNDSCNSPQVKRCIELAAELSNERELSVSIYERHTDGSQGLEYVFYPERVADQQHRHLLGLALSCLSEKPDVVFLFKLSRCVLNGVVLGINHTQGVREQYFNESISFPMHYGYLQQAKRNPEMYAVDLQSI